MSERHTPDTAATEPEPADTAADEGADHPVSVSDRAARIVAALRRRGRRLIHDYTKTVALLIVAIAAGLAALVCFPTDTPVAPNGRLRSIEVDATGFSPKWVYIQLTPRRSRNATEIDAEVTSDAPPSSPAVLKIEVPPMTWGKSSYCGPGASRCARQPGEKAAYFRFRKPIAFFNVAQLQYKQITHVYVPGVGYNVAKNGEYVSAILPSVQTYLTQPRQGLIHEDVDTDIAMYMLRASRYTWTLGAPPDISGGYATWSFAPAPGSEEVANGVSLSVQDEDTRLTFIAGALLGIAGAALVGAIQEAVKR